MSIPNQDESDILQVEGINSKGFGTVPKLLMQDKRLSVTSKAIYCYFCSYAGSGRSAFPKVSKIIEDLKINRETYYIHFNPLKELGYIKVRPTRKNGKQSSNIYTLMEIIPLHTKNGMRTEDSQYTELQESEIPYTELQESEIPYTELQESELQESEIPYTEIPDTNINRFKINRSNKNNNSKKHPPNPPQAWGESVCEAKGRTPSADNPIAFQMTKSQCNQPSENLKLKMGGGKDSESLDHSTTLVEQQFEVFWNAYPKKVGKTAVFKAWQRLNPHTALYAQILGAIETAKVSAQWQKENGRFIPNPLTWISQGRWDDVYPAPVAQVQSPQQGGTALTRLMAKIEAAENGFLESGT